MNTSIQTDLLADLRDTLSQLNCLMERARGPGKHHVFMAVAEGCANLRCAVRSEEQRCMTTEPTTPPASPPLTAPTGSVSDAEWGLVLWNWIREMLPDADCYLEIDMEELMKLAEKHGRARKVKYDPATHGGICDVNPGDEIWWWGDPMQT